MPEKDIVFTAVWTEAWNVTFCSNEGYINGHDYETIEKCQIQKNYSISYDKVPYVGWRDGYYFLGWALEDNEDILYVSTYELQEGENSIFDYIPDGDVKFVAKWAKEEYISVDEFSFSDENFRAYVLSKFDMDGDMKLSSTEIKRVKYIDITSKEITSLKGIEYFNSLVRLGCGKNSLESIDLSKNFSLEYLDCDNNQLTELILNNNKNLEWLDCFSNKLTTIDLSNNTKLTHLFCWDNKFEKVDVENNIITYYYPESEELFYDDYKAWGGSVSYDEINGLIIINNNHNEELISDKEKDSNNTSKENESLSNADVNQQLNQKRELEKASGDSTQTREYESNTNVKTISELTPGSNTKTTSELLSVGKVVDNNSVEYLITENTDGQIKVAYQKPTDSNKTSYTIPDTIILSDGTVAQVTEIDSNAFKKCKKIKKVIIGKNVSKVRKNAFGGCKNLKTIIVKSTKLTKNSVGKNAFKGINKKATFKCPKKQYKNYKKWIKKAGAPKTAKYKK